MSRFRSYLEVSKQVIVDYRGELPFATYLKNFFSGKKKFGSTDRKTIATLCYSFFRAGHALTGELEKRIVNAFFLCADKPNPFLQNIREDLNTQVEIPIAEKLELLHVNVQSLFPFSNHLSREINADDFCISLLQQPRLFIRARPGKEKLVVQKLSAAKLEFTNLEGSAIALANGTKLEGVMALNRDAVVQDVSSQHTLDFLQGDLFAGLRVDVWDCCAASGGKSILVNDRLKGKMRLTVTDIRTRVLKNLTGRLAQAGVPVYNSRLADLEKPLKEIGSFQLIICDAPCTGSGTWGRVPEQLHHFKEDKLSYYSKLQKQIILNSIAQLEAGGIFVYITCSVFTEENEEQVDFILQRPGMELLHREYIKGYDRGADTLFTSTFRLSL